MVAADRPLYEYVGKTAGVISAIERNPGPTTLSLPLKPFGSSQEPVEAQFTGSKKQVTRAREKVTASGTIQVGSGPSLPCLLAYYPRYGRIYILPPPRR